MTWMIHIRNSRTDQSVDFDKDCAMNLLESEIECLQPGETMSLTYEGDGSDDELCEEEEAACDRRVYVFRKARAYKDEIVLTRSSTDGTFVSVRMSPEEAEGLAECLTYGGGFLSEDGAIEVKATLADMNEDGEWVDEMVWNDGRKIVDMVPDEDSTDSWATDLADELIDAAKHASEYKILTLQGNIAKREPSPVDHPEHYRKDSGYEAIDVIEAWDLGFSLGNALKYICRAGLKGDEIEDLEKARWYIDREIERRRKR